MGGLRVVELHPEHRFAEQNAHRQVEQQARQANVDRRSHGDHSEEQDRRTGQQSGVQTAGVHAVTLDAEHSTYAG